MKQLVDTLTEEIEKLEKETELIEKLDVKLTERLKHNHREITLNELEIVLDAMEIGAATRVTQELFIYAIPRRGTILLDAKQNYRFQQITLQEIELYTMYNLEEGIKPIWNKTNRLTSYTEFKDRATRLLKEIQDGKLDEYLGYSASELLYEILGVNGELLEKIGINVTKSYTTTRINQIIQRAKDNLRIFSNLRGESK